MRDFFTSFLIDRISHLFGSQLLSRLYGRNELERSKHNKISLLETAFVHFLKLSSHARGRTELINHNDISGFIVLPYPLQGL